MAERQLHSIQTLRGVAASMVVFVHAVGSVMNSGRDTPLGGLKDIGSAGVDIFFVISGFLMVATTAGRAPGVASALAFMKSRLRRIVPLYWLLTTVMLAAIVLLPSAFGRAHFDLGRAVASYLFVPSAGGPVIFTGWTLSYEMWFYLVFAVLLLFPRRALLPSLAVFFLGSALASLAHPTGEVATMLTSPMLVEFVMGAALGSLYLRYPMARPKRAAAAAFVLGVVLLIASLPLIPNHGDWARSDWHRVWMWGAPCLLIVAGLVGLERARAFSELRPLTVLGDCSYSIYLSHVFTIPATMKAMAHLPIPGTVAVLVAFGASVAVGYLVYALAERPADKWLRSSMLRVPAGAARARIGDSTSSGSLEEHEEGALVCMPRRFKTGA